MSTGEKRSIEGGSPLTADHLSAWVDQLAGVDANAADNAIIDQIAELERIKSACAALQARLTVVFVQSQTDGLPAAKARDERAHRSIAAQVALARKDSPVRGGRHVGLAKALIREMPNTYAALQGGEISEWRATLLVRETACLTVEHRRQVDAELAGQLAGLGDRGTAGAAARIAQRLDPEACVARNRKAVNERRVSIRPAPDTMTYVSALLPVAQGVAVYAGLTRYADCKKATGDPRSRGQLMADELVHRITQHTNGAAALMPTTPGANDTDSDSDSTVDAAGPESTRGADTDSDSDSDVTVDAAAPDSTSDGNTEGPHTTAAGETTYTAGNPADMDTAATRLPAGTGIDIQLIMTDRTLFDGDDEPAHLTGHGPIPAPLARRLVRDAAPNIKAWIRRLYTDPATGHLITGDAHRRSFNHAQRQFTVARDQTCRTPYCDAPIRHADHITSRADGGPTTLGNDQGLCAGCNYLKEATGWTSRPDPDGPGVTITTPTGHTHHSKPPPPPSSPPWDNQPDHETPSHHRILDEQPSRRFDVA